MTPRPRVSVCIPTVNRPDLFREAIASVAAQTWRDFEVVVADNSADPDCQKKIDDVLAEFSNLRIVLHRHPVRLDAIDNFNSLIDAAQGDLWACLPDDDRFTPNFLARSVEALDRHPECAFTFADHWIMDAAGKVDEPESARNSVRFGRASLREGIYRHDALFDLVLKQAICLQTALFRRPVIAGLRFLPGIMAGDHSFFLRLSTGSEQFHAHYIDERLFEYRIHQSQITSTTNRRDLIRAQIASFESIPPLPPHRKRSVHAKLSRCYLALALVEAEEGDRDTARAHAARSLHLAVGVRSVLGSLLVSMAPFAVRDVRRLQKLFKARRK